MDRARTHTLSQLSSPITAKFYFHFLKMSSTVVVGVLDADAILDFI